MSVHAERANDSFLVASSAAVQSTHALLFTFLTAVGAQIVIPHEPVPFTMQTLVVLLAGGVLGRQNGALSMGAYLLAGAIGLPVFAGLGLGFARIVGPTGGYLLAFPLAAYLCGLLLETPRPSIIRIVAAVTLSLTVVFLVGTLQLYAVTDLSFAASFASGFLIFSAWDLLKIIAASAVIFGVHRRKR